MCPLGFPNCKLSVTARGTSQERTWFVAIVAVAGSLHWDHSTADCSHSSAGRNPGYTLFDRLEISRTY